MPLAKLLFQQTVVVMPAKQSNTWVLPLSICLFSSKRTPSVRDTPGDTIVPQTPSVDLMKCLVSNENTIDNYIDSEIHVLDE